MTVWLGREVSHILSATEELYRRRVRPPKEVCCALAVRFDERRHQAGKRTNERTANQLGWSTRFLYMPPLGLTAT
jgi:hypothetical protein